jgi:hypothetical protein
MHARDRSASLSLEHYTPVGSSQSFQIKEVEEEDKERALHFCSEHVRYKDGFAVRCSEGTNVRESEALNAHTASISFTNGAFSVATYSLYGTRHADGHTHAGATAGVESNNIIE